MGSKPVGPIAGETAHSGRALCEEFAPRNEGIRPSGERGANRPAPGPPISEFPVRGSRKGTEIKGLAGSRARTVPAPGPPISEFPVRGSRLETEIKGLAGNRARTVPADRAAFSESPGPWFECVQFCEVTFTINPKIILKKIKKVLDKRVVLLYNKSCVEQRK